VSMARCPKTHEQIPDSVHTGIGPPGNLPYFQAAMVAAGCRGREEASLAMPAVLLSWAAWVRCWAVSGQ